MNTILLPTSLAAALLTSVLKHDKLRADVHRRPMSACGKLPAQTVIPF
jgi:hypothetical protein